MCAGQFYQTKDFLKQKSLQHFVDLQSVAQVQVIQPSLAKRKTVWNDSEDGQHFLHSMSWYFIFSCPFYCRFMISVLLEITQLHVLHENNLPSSFADLPTTIEKTQQIFQQMALPHNYLFFFFNNLILLLYSV